MKHINIRYHFILDILVKGRVVVKKIVIAENPVDMVTKHVHLENSMNDEHYNLAIRTLREQHR